MAHPYAPSGVGFSFFNPQLRPLSGSLSQSDAEFNTKIASLCRRLVIFPPFRPDSLAKRLFALQERASGEMAEWLKAHAWKACVRETVPWVRIPLSPPANSITCFLHQPNSRNTSTKLGSIKSSCTRECGGWAIRPAEMAFFSKASYFVELV